ncbi:MAG: ATP phosphoribosyltransferase regulatory subunit [Pyrinomonadaceae bacterium]
MRRRSDALARLGFANYTLRLNHRQVLAGVLERAGVPAEQQAEALVALDKLDKIGAEGVARELIERGIDQQVGERLLGFFSSLQELKQAAQLAATTAGVDEVEALNVATLGRLVEFIGDHEAGAQGVDDLRTILRFAKFAGAASRLKLDPGLARGLSYYTGAIMEISVPDLPGSLGGGGRYDNLVGMFSGKDVPACGFSLGLERIIVVMGEREMFPLHLTAAPSAEVMVAVWDEPGIEDALALARELRRDGLRVEIYAEPDKLGKQFKYASTRNVPAVAVIGPDERGRGEVAIKDMRSGSQQTVRRENAGQAVKGIARPA